MIFSTAAEKYNVEPDQILASEESKNRKKKLGDGKRPKPNKEGLAMWMAEHNDGSFVAIEKPLLSFQGGISLGAMAVYVYVSQFFNAKVDPFPSLGKIARYYRSSPETISKYLDELEALGLIVKRHTGRNNSYSLPYHDAADEKRRLKQAQLLNEMMSGKSK